MVKIFVITYSTYGHINTLAESIVKGLEKSGVEVGRYQIAETLPEEVLEKMYASPKADIPIINIDDLPEADGFLFGFPTRFGSAPAQFKTFFDATGGLWKAQALVGKPTGFFYSTGAQHGGQEATVFSTLPILAHHGMIFVPLGFTNPHLLDNSELVGGSAWGAGTMASGDGSRQPTPKELAIAETQGENFGNIAKKLAA
ncbi:flavodoxin-like protein [Coemansia reversa NRRL 1564]|uniref:Flavodoxin-like protein n=1 Tax=Coemansia reversa (strain ATCC 12441 / NRRL 1564) TaxID=763665 RepID=A0A2G5BJU2_COERN|nr:flavodoxin-like protein [Coemansia reversa NRRL 1564]|eukprot:PIA19278.1 flavodoxin-like protein [Coemansia reversa NRRL 1564]